MKEKWIIFRDYYLKGTIIAIIVIGGLIGYYIYGVVTTKDKILQVITMDVQCSLEQADEFVKETGKIIGINDKEEIIDISFNQSTEMFTALVTGNSMDIFFMDKNNFEKMLSWEYVYPLDEIIGVELGQKESNNELTIYRGADEKIYGFSIKDNLWMKQFDFVSNDDIIVGVAEGAPNMENVRVMLQFLMEE